MRPRLRLQATQPNRQEALRVLALQLEAQRNPPEVSIGRVEELSSLTIPPHVDLIVLVGDLLPVELIAQAQSAGIGLFWAEAGPEPRLDRRSLLPHRLRQTLSRLDRVHARDAAAAAAIERLARGSVAVEISGQLARIPPAAPCNEPELAALRRAMGARPVWFGFSLPVSEFDAILAAQISAMRQAHRLLLLAAPQDPQQGPELVAQARALGLVTAQRMAEDEIDESVQVYITDSEDAPGLFLRLAPVTYIGGTLTPGAASPPVAEAASLGTAMLFGPERTDPLMNRLQQAGGGSGIIRRDELGAALGELLVPETCARIALNAWNVSTDGSEATLRLARAIDDWLLLRPRAGRAG